MLNLNDDQLAFHDPLETNDSALQVPLGDDTRREIARELAEKVRAIATIGWAPWALMERTRARLRIVVRRILLARHGCPPDKQPRRSRPCWSTSSA